MGERDYHFGVVNVGSRLLIPLRSLVRADYEGILRELLEEAFLRRPVDIEVESLCLADEEHEAN